MLNTGDKAPSFSLKNQENETVSLQDFKGKKVLVWFFPKLVPLDERSRDRDSVMSSKNFRIMMWRFLV